MSDLSDRERAELTKWRAHFSSPAIALKAFSFLTEQNSLYRETMLKIDKLLYDSKVKP
jgi:hypothetical protein